MELGSSPRMRGTPLQLASHECFIGIIPAYAGNTMCATPALPSTRDHPRVCGEHQHRAPETAMELGSSPRMRGTHGEQVVGDGEFGIIPAYAGNTSAICHSYSYMRDHPRICGEHLASLGCVRGHGGSSPRMRGTLGSQVDTCHVAGIIPAYAGNTVDGVLVAAERGDHPRVCGEHAPLTSFVAM